MSYNNEHANVQQTIVNDQIIYIQYEVYNITYNTKARQRETSAERSSPNMGADHQR